MTITFAQKISHSTSSYAKTGLAQCDRVSLYRYNAVLSDVKDKLQESEKIQIITGFDSGVTAAYILIQWEK